MRLCDIAPRLARARDQWLQEQAWTRRRRRYLEHEELRLQRLVAHRELQLIRAGDGRRRRQRSYLEVRAQKLAAARRWLSAVQDEMKRRAA